MKTKEEHTGARIPRPRSGSIRSMRIIDNLTLRAHINSEEPKWLHSILSAKDLRLYDCAIRLPRHSLVTINVHVGVVQYVHGGANIPTAQQHLGHIRCASKELKEMIRLR